MDIHKPKPWHGWREFLKEYGIIVLGVLTALAFEQSVEWLHWRHEVTETRKALDAELSHNLFAFDQQLGQTACISDRLLEIERWVALQRQGRFTPLKSQIVEPSGLNLHFAIWDAASGEARAHIPLEARMSYAKLYDALRQHKVYDQQDEQSWQHLNDFSLDHSTTRDELQAVEGAVRRLQGHALEWPRYKSYIDGLAHDLGIRADTTVDPDVKVALAGDSRRLCAPLL